MNDKYIGNTKELLQLAKMILYAFYNDELILIVIHGKQGYGKSTYASIIIAQVYGIHNLINSIIEKQPELLINKKTRNPKTEAQIRNVKIRILKNIIETKQEFEYDWNAAKKFLIFTPRQFLSLSRKQKKKAPGSCVDDAGLWLNAMDYQHPLVKATGKFLEVARTRWGAIIFTCSDLKQIFTKIRNMPHVYTVRITKITSPTSFDRRSAKIYEGWISEDLKKSGRKAQAIDIYYAHMPDTFFNWYKPERAKLTDRGLDELETELDKLGI